MCRRLSTTRSQQCNQSSLLYYNLVDTNVIRTPTLQKCNIHVMHSTLFLTTLPGHCQSRKQSPIIWLTFPTHDCVNDPLLICTAEEGMSMYRYTVESSVRIYFEKLAMRLSAIYTLALRIHRLCASRSSLQRSASSDLDQYQTLQPMMERTPTLRHLDSAS